MMVPVTDFSIAPSLYSCGHNSFNDSDNNFTNKVVKSNMGTTVFIKSVR